MTGGRPCEARILRSAIRDNFALVRRRAAPADVVAVVKADAYGHGAAPFCETLAAAGCRRFAVLSVAEAAALREAGRPEWILVLGGVHDAGEAAHAARLGVVPVVHGEACVERLSAAARERGAPLPVHVEIDTGMRRMGVRDEAAHALLRRVAGAPGLVLEGVFTHLACADEEDAAPTEAQLATFARRLAEVRADGIEPALVHVANSAGVLAHLGVGPGVDAVRAGLALYGAPPAPHLGEKLRPVMTLAARVVSLRALVPGEAVGYGGTYRAERPTRIATLPLGYADGVPRRAGNRGQVWLAGRRLPIVGRVSMDYLAVDVGDAPVELGDEAELFGANLPVDEAAAAVDTLAYELLVRVGPRVPRVYVDA